MNNPNWGAQTAASIDNASNIIATGTANRKTREWNEKILQQQRSWALEDWDRQNAYNSPAAQMQRYKEAGLNPMLIYGQTNTASPVRSTEAKQWNPQAVRVETGELLGKYMNVELGRQQIDNLKAQNAVLRADAILKAGTSAGQAITNAKSQLDLEMATELKNTSLEYARENLRKLMTEHGLVANQSKALHNRTEYEAELHPGEVVKQRLQNMVSQQDLKRLEAITQSEQYRVSVNRLDAKLADMGVRPSDPMWHRMIMTVINEVYKRYFK